MAAGGFGGVAALDEPRGQAFELTRRQENHHGRAVAGEALDLFALGHGRSALHARQNDRLLTSGRVYSARSAAAAPQNEETPGDLVCKAEPVEARAICSRCAP